MWHFHCVKVSSVCGKGYKQAYFQLFSMLNKRSIKLYTTSCDVTCWSVATSFHSTLIFNIHRTFPFTIWSRFIWKGRQTESHN